MTTATRRRTTLGVVALLPALTALLVLRPAPAAGQDPAVGFFAMTVTAASTNTSGDIGAGGGLTPVDSGAPVVKGRLDSSPTASMVAAAVEPGTLYRTGAALANNEAGEEVVPVEFARAAFPGGPDEDVSDPTATGVEGPFANGTVEARAQADERAITGVARVAEQSLGAGAAPTRGSVTTLLDGLGALAADYPTAVRTPTDQDPALVRQRGGHAEATATGDPAAGTLVASSSSTAETVTIAGTITIDDVRGVAVARLEDGTTSASAGTTYAGIRIADVPVALGTDGLQVTDEVPLLPGQELASLEDRLNAVLEAAGIQITPLSPLEATEDGSARADSGGVRVAITTPSGAAVPANVVEVVVGQAVATLSAEPPMPAPAPLPPSTPVDTGGADVTDRAGGSTAATDTADAAVSRTSPSTTSPGTAVPPTASAPTPAVAAPEVATGEPGEPTMVLAGRRIPQRTALALFGGWQLLSLSTCTLAAFALRGSRP